MEFWITGASQNHAERRQRVGACAPVQMLARPLLLSPSAAGPGGEDLPAGAIAGFSRPLSDGRLMTAGSVPAL